MDLSIIIPAHNEEASIADPAFRDNLSYLRGQSDRAEVILVDDGSTDNTAERAEPLVDQVLRREHRGKAFALQAGFAAARGYRVLWTDADWSVPCEVAPRLLSRLDAGRDYVFASRGWSRPGAPVHRWLGSCFFTWVIRNTFHWDFTDTQCGMKAARRDSLMRLLSVLRRFRPDNGVRHAGTDAMFDIECLLACRKLELQVEEFHTSWLHCENREAQRYGPLLRQIFRDFRVVRRYYRAGKYD